MGILKPEETKQPTMADLAVKELQEIGGLYDQRDRTQRIETFGRELHNALTDYELIKGGDDTIEHLTEQVRAVEGARDALRQKLEDAEVLRDTYKTKAEKLAAELRKANAQLGFTTTIE